MSDDLLFIAYSPFLTRCQDIFSDSKSLLHFCSSGQEALELIAKGLRPAVVIADQKIVSLDGEDLFAALKGHRPRAKLIVVAGEYNPDLMARAINSHGVFRYYTKDIEANVQEGVAAALVLHQQQQEYIGASARMEGLNAELEELTFHLEKTVDYHLGKFKKSNAENIELSGTLRRTVLELEGRDRVLRHLLTVHSLDDTLDTILEVLNVVLNFNFGVIYIKTEQGELQPISRYPEDAHPSKTHSGLALEALSRRELRVENSIEKSHTCVAVPICKGDNVLGVIEVCWLDEKGGGQVDEDELLAHEQSIYTFTVHAAIAITDHNLTHDKSNWSTTLDDVLLDFME
jgi:CheY-like chemotaxis protein